MWNLLAPEGFRGFDPLAPVTVYHRHLPHWRQEGATYAVTFRQADALPQVRIEELRLLRRDWEARHPEPRSEADWETYAREFTRRVDAWLDESSGSCRFREQSHVDILVSALTKFHGTRYHTGAYAILPNHCHLVIRPFPGEDLSKILQGIKGAVARKVQQQCGTTGEPLWEAESYDRIVRDEEHLARAVAYLGQNPEKAGLAAERTWRCGIAVDWSEAGWSFDAFAT
jgi:putative transposase